MAYHNPFIDKNGQIKFPDNTDLVRHVEKWAKVRGDQLAYRFLDFSTERDGVARDMSWAEFGARNRAVGARLQQVTQPGDRVAILCPQSLDYLVAFFGVLYAGRIAVPLFDPAEPGHVGRLHAVLDDFERFWPASVAFWLIVGLCLRLRRAHTAADTYVLSG